MLHRKDGMIFKSFDPQWPRCTCNRCVFEHLEFTLYFPINANDRACTGKPGTKSHKRRNKRKRSRFVMAMGTWVEKCPNCGDVFDYGQRLWVRAGQPKTEITE